MSERGSDQVGPLWGWNKLVPFVEASEMISCSQSSAGLRPVFHFTHLLKWFVSMSNNPTLSVVTDPQRSAPESAPLLGFRDVTFSFSPPLPGWFLLSQTSPCWRAQVSAILGPFPFLSSFFF
uniref:Uncharacterized protein n=1 Tax=Myotis myotis TaxID=51298 RepID=A0A7J7ZY35_MYOMY|nr:hypothetical protein mMyoMyo1_009928 [Myotis myotis]